MKSWIDHNHTHQLHQPCNYHNNWTQLQVRAAVVFEVFESPQVQCLGWNDIGIKIHNRVNTTTCNILLKPFLMHHQQILQVFCPREHKGPLTADDCLRIRIKNSHSFSIQITCNSLSIHIICCCIAYPTIINDNHSNRNNNCSYHSNNCNNCSYNKIRTLFLQDQVQQQIHPHTQLLPSIIENHLRIVYLPWAQKKLFSTPMILRHSYHVNKQMPQQILIYWAGCLQTYHSVQKLIEGQQMEWKSFI